MSLPLAAVMALSQQCAPEIALEAIVPQVQVESSFNELAIGINNGPAVRVHSLADAVAIATWYIRAGYSVDLGLAQINSHNLSRLNMTVEQAFDPCTSLRAAEYLLIENYADVSTHSTGLDAINATWSLYNSGSATRGIRNGYVRKVWTAANSLVPQMQALLKMGSPDREGEAPAPPAAPTQPRWFYGNADSGAIVFKEQ